MVGFGSIANLGASIPLGQLSWLPSVMGLPPLDLTAALAGMLVVLLGLFGISALGILAAADRRQHRDRARALSAARPAHVVPLRRTGAASPPRGASIEDPAGASAMPAQAGAA